MKTRGSSPISLAQYRYDGLGQRVAERTNADQDSSYGSAEPWWRLIYDDRWRVVMVFHESDGVDEPKELIVRHNAGSYGLGGSSYIDGYAVRERDENGGSAN